MKLSIYNEKKEKTGDLTLPSQFTESYRPTLIRRAVLALLSGLRSPYGASAQAGMRHSSSLSKRRRKYRGSYGFGISRVARKIHSRRGTRMHWVGATTPQTVGGRRAHAPKPQKNFVQSINIKERRKAIRSALAATIDVALVQERGHHVPTEFPFVLDASFESLSKTKDVRAALVSLGFKDELTRSATKKVRAGKGTLRGRKYQKKKGVLLVVANDCPLVKSAKNLAGVDVVAVHALNAHLLAPGAVAGRVTLWTKPALDRLETERLFAQ